ncbi:uncharacterized protein LTR77_000282 [Saxophila tyrrhenica]|uniref:Uncharacterized protein n=1 Tax=Saxophila tyrrhenica TaxID=1690608 RepID=A0AAV9PS28_9PEZI|nr:hypothetical protein LTR77_000282 [Saxophila tyrrhenica]
MTSWLNKQKKQALLELSADAGLKHDDGLLKDEIVERLDNYLQRNATRLSRNATFEPYYSSMRRTPFKPRSSSSAPGVTSGDDGEVKSVVKARGRRTTKVKDEGEDDYASASPSQAIVPSSSTLATRTPGRPRRPELPASPADVADEVEYATRRMSANIDDLYTGSGIPEFVESVREMCSSVIGVQVSCLLLEGICLSRNLLPLTQVGPAFTKSYELFGLSIPETRLMLPNLFQLVESDFWMPTLLWSATSIFIPLFFAYFYNLSVRDIKRGGTKVSVARYRADPLTFNVVKALLAFVVYNNDHVFSFIHPKHVCMVNASMLGGYRAMLVGGYVGILATMYEAAQRK